MQHTIACPSCGTQYSFDTSLSFREECERCAADLHVCLTCRFHDRYVENECRETEADYVAQKDRRNLCEYWKPRGGEREVNEADAARAKLEALFGGKPQAPSSPTPSATSPSAASSEADEAKRRLEALFKKK